MKAVRKLTADQQVTAELYDAAERRVNASPTLRKYAAFILADWPEGDDHWRWVCKAPVREIAAWAKAGLR